MRNCNRNWLVIICDVIWNRDSHRDYFRSGNATNRAVSTTPNKRDYLDRDLNRDSDSTFFSCVDTINAIISGI